MCTCSNEMVYWRQICIEIGHRRNRSKCKGRNWLHVRFSGATAPAAQQFYGFISFAEIVVAKRTTVSSALLFVNHLGPKSQVFSWNLNETIWQLQWHFWSLKEKLEPKVHPCKKIGDFFHQDFSNLLSLLRQTFMCRKNKSIQNLDGSFISYLALMFKIGTKSHCPTIDKFWTKFSCNSLEKEA